MLRAYCLNTLLELIIEPSFTLVDKLKMSIIFWPVWPHLTGSRAVGVKVVMSVVGEHTTGEPQSRLDGVDIGATRQDKSRNSVWLDTRTEKVSTVWPNWEVQFLAVQNSSIGLIVCWSVGPAPLTIKAFTTLQSDPRDLWPLRHLIRVMRRHDLTKNTYIPTRSPT